MFKQSLSVTASRQKWIEGLKLVEAKHIRKPKVARFAKMSEHLKNESGEEYDEAFDAKKNRLELEMSKRKQEFIST